MTTWCGAQIINYEIDIYFRVHITATLKKVNLLHNKDLRTTQNENTWQKSPAGVEPLEAWSPMTL